ncbi:UPF0503 protein, chloroplastic [Glycine soja]
MGSKNAFLNQYSKDIDCLIILGHKSLSSFHKSMLLLSPALFHPHRPANSCGCHPEEHFIGFCPSCLYERLTILKHDGSSSIDTRPITSLTSPEANCQPFTTTLDGNHLPKSSSITFNPKLCSTKSFPALKNEGLSCALEPRRKSCDVIPYSPLFSISNPDDKHEIPIKEPKVETCNLTSSSIIELEADVEAEKTLKARDDLLDIDSQGKKSSSRDLKECIWFDTTNFRKKFRKWRQKQKMKKRFMQRCEDELVIKLLGKKIGCGVMKDKLNHSWCLSRVFDIKDINNGYFINLIWKRSKKRILIIGKCFYSKNLKELLGVEQVQQHGYDYNSINLQFANEGPLAIIRTQPRLRNMVKASDESSKDIVTYRDTEKDFAIIHVKVYVASLYLDQSIDRELNALGKGNQKMLLFKGNSTLFNTIFNTQNHGQLWDGSQTFVTVDFFDCGLIVLFLDLEDQMTTLRVEGCMVFNGLICIEFYANREIAQLVCGLTPGFDHHEGLVAVVDDGLRVIDEPNHLVEDTLGGDFGEGLLAVLDKGFEEDKGEVLNPRALEDDPLLDSADEFDATELVGVDEIAEIEI